MVPPSAGLEAIIPVVTQMYNDSVHAMHQNAGGQETQRGLQTAALAAGYEGLTNSNSEKGSAFWREADAALPFERQLQMLSRQSGGTPPSKDLRVESVFSINMACLHPGDRDGL